MNFIRRWRHGAERDQEQLLVRLWTLNHLNSDDYMGAVRLAADAKNELKLSLKHLSGVEVERTIERTVAEAEYRERCVYNLRKHIRHAHGEY